MFSAQCFEATAARVLPALALMPASDRVRRTQPASTARDAALGGPQAVKNKLFALQTDRLSDDSSITLFVQYTGSIVR